jgi:hypothetical protein
MLKTLPFIIFRLMVYFGVALAYILMTGVGAGVGWGIGGFGEEGFRAASTFWGGLIGFGIVGAIMYALREYLLYVVKAGHIAVLVELIDGGTLPEGRSQLQHASGVIRERFGQASLLFAVDQLIKGVLRSITGMFRTLFRLLPIPGAQTLLRIVEGFLRMAVGFIDEVILAYCIRTRADNAWEASRESLVLYGQNARPMLNAWSVKAALLEPFAVACMMQAYFKVIDGQQPDPEWEARLDGMSSKFRRLKAKAMEACSAGDGRHHGLTCPTSTSWVMLR